jgi:hypothetical protein
MVTTARGGARVLAVMWIFAFGVYATTASKSLHGYDPGAASSAQGFYETGRFELLPDPLYSGPGEPGRDGRSVSYVGLPEAALMVPFYAVGAALDDAFDRPADGESFRELAMVFYEPLIAATAAALFALIVLRVRRSVPWAVAGGVLFTVATMAWPYSKIGMDTTVMLGAVLTLAGVVYARDGGTFPAVVAGFGAGMTVAGKAYEGLAVIALLALLVPILRAAGTRRRVLLIAAVTAPAALWAVAVAWYNVSRYGSPFDFGQADFVPTLAAPINAVGYFVSPGKGLLWYSPLVILGLLGLKQLHARDRALARSIIAAVVAGTAVVAINTYWTDETWGPRYLLPVAWLLLIPIPFWAVTRRRRAILGAIAVLAVAVQLCGVLVTYEASYLVGEALGQDPRGALHGEPRTYFGHDASRWVPGLSPLAINGALASSWLATSVGLPPIEFTYHPFMGQEHSLVMNAATAKALGIPDLWWLSSRDQVGIAALLPAMAMLLAALALTRMVVADGATPEWMGRSVRRCRSLARSRA